MTRSTALLAGALLALVGVDVAVHRPEPAPPPLPALPKADPDRIALAHGDEEVTLEKTDGGWRLAGGGPADPDAVAALLAPLTEGVVLDARVDDQDPARYGLVAPDVLRVDAGDLSLYVGATAPGGSSYVRLPDDPSIYRARLGGRGRFERADWRDLTVLSAPDVTAIRVAPAAHPATELRKPWTIAATGEEPDPERLGLLLDTFARWRAVEVVSADHPALAAPVATVELSRAGGEVVRVEVGRTAQAGFARTGDQAFRVDGALVDLLAGPPETWWSRTLTDTAPGLIERVALTEGGETVALARAEGGWVVEPDLPANDVAAERVANHLAAWSAERRVTIDPKAAGFPSERRLRLELRHGDSYTVEIGAHVGPSVYVRSDAGWIGTISLAELGALRAAFGR